MNRGKVEIVLVASGSVGTQDQAMDGVVLVCWTTVRLSVSVHRKRTDRQRRTSLCLEAIGRSNLASRERG